VIFRGNVRLAVMAQALHDELPRWRVLLRRRARRVRDDALRRLSAL